MYAKNKNIVKIAIAGEEALSSIPINEVRVIEKFQYVGKRSDLVVLNGKSIVVMHNGLRQIILPVDQLSGFISELSELSQKI